MSLHSALGDARTQLAGTCDIGRLLDELGPHDADRLRTALDDPTEASEVIVAALAAKGHTVGMSSVVNHRNGDCPGP